MAAFSEKDFTQLFIGAAATKTTGAISTLNDGEIGLFTPSGTRLTESSAATATEFIIVKGRASGAIKLHSGTIKKADLVSAKCVRKVYSAATEQLDYVGYNGTSGSLDVIDDNLYYIRLHMDQTRFSNHGGVYVKHAVYKSPITGTTQADVAFNLCESGVKNFKREKDRLIKFERVHSDAGTANTITAGTDATYYTFTHGSKFVTGTDSTGSPLLGTDEIVATTVAGDYLRAGTNTTDPVYKIVAVNAGTASTPMSIELDLAWQGDTTSIDITATEYITAALAAAGDFGLKLTALTQTFSVGALRYKKSKWVTKLENFTDTLVTKDTASFDGVGDYRQIAEMEWYYQGNEGTIYRKMVPTFVPRAEAATSGGYDQIILHVDTKDNYPLSATNASKDYIIALPDTAPNYAVTGTADDITDVLEVLVFGSANGNFAIS